VAVDREALEHSPVRRLLDHVEQGTTDLADAVLEAPAATYTSSDRLAQEAEALFSGQPLVLCLSGALPGPGSYRTVGFGRNEPALQHVHRGFASAVSAARGAGRA
jgi:hypothetical protein